MMLYLGWGKGVPGALLLVFWSWIEHSGVGLVTVDLFLQRRLIAGSLRRSHVAPQLLLDAVQAAFLQLQQQQRLCNALLVLRAEPCPSSRRSFDGTDFLCIPLYQDSVKEIDVSSALPESN